MTCTATVVRSAAVCLAAIFTFSACSARNVKGGGSKASSGCDAAVLDLSYETRVLSTLRIYTGADGLSHAETVAQPAQESTYLGALLRQYPLGDPSNVVIVSGPPDFHISQHPAPYREIFVLLSGTSVIDLSDGTQQALRPGSVVVFEDTTGPGHAGHFGPCGYVALDIQFKPKSAPVNGPS